MFGNKFKVKDLVSLTLLLLLMAAIPLGVKLIEQQQILKGRASSNLDSCVNKLIFGFNGPVNNKIRELFTSPSLNFIPVAWKDIQPNQSSAYDFSKVDKLINDTIAEGRTPTIKFCDGDCFPDWARQMDTAPERTYCCSTDYVCRVLKEDTGTANAFSDVVKAMVNRYKDKVHYWDYGIEPNCRGYNPQKYTGLLKNFANSVRSQDSGAVIVGGHLAGANIDYLRAMYAAGAKPYFDRLSVDPYGEPLDFNALEVAHNYMVSQGDGNKKIWLGEWGLATNNDETKQADQVQIGLNYLANQSWIEAAFYHNFECELWTSTCSPGTPGYLGFGLTKSDGSVKLAYNTFKHAVSACMAATPTAQPSPIASPTTSASPTGTISPVPTVSWAQSTPTPISSSQGNNSGRATSTSTPSYKRNLSKAFPTPTPLPTLSQETLKFDYNGDNKVNSFDVGLFIQGWLKNDASGIVKFDANGDGIINSLDYSLLVKSVNP